MDEPPLDRNVFWKSLLKTEVNFKEHNHDCSVHYVQVVSNRCKYVHEVTNCTNVGLLCMYTSVSNRCKYVHEVTNYTNVGLLCMYTSVQRERQQMKECEAQNDNGFIIRPFLCI